MKKVSILVLLLGFLSSGCSHVWGSAPPTPNVTGEIWYSKVTTFLFMPVSSGIFYCPAPSGDELSETIHCVEAELVDAPVRATAYRARAASPAPRASKPAPHPVAERPSTSPPMAAFADSVYVGDGAYDDDLSAAVAKMQTWEGHLVTAQTSDDRSVVGLLHQVSDISGMIKLLVQGRTVVLRMADLERVSLHK